MSEIEGGSLLRRHSMEGFREVLEGYNLRDLGYAGLWCTWERGRNPSTRIRDRIDRFLASIGWCESFPHAYVEHLPRYKSDHMPILILVQGAHRIRKKRKKPFRFETTLLLNDECESVVRSAWEGSIGSPREQQIGSLAEELKGWSRGSLNKLGKKIEEVEGDLKNLQQQDDGRDHEKEKTLQGKLDDLLEQQEAYWFLSSRVSEIRDGDKNTQYFHCKASQHKKKSY